MQNLYNIYLNFYNKINPIIEEIEIFFCSTTNIWDLMFYSCSFQFQNKCPTFGNDLIFFYKSC